MNDESKIDANTLERMRLELSFHHFGYIDTLFTDQEKQALGQSPMGQLQTCFPKQHRRILDDILRYDNLLGAIYRLHGLDSPEAAAEELLTLYGIQMLECARRGVPLWTNLYDEWFEREKGEKRT